MIKTDGLSTDAIKKLVTKCLQAFLEEYDTVSNFQEYLEENLSEELDDDTPERIVEAFVEEAKELAEEVLAEIAQNL